MINTFIRHSNTFFCQIRSFHLNVLNEPNFNIGDQEIKLNNYLFVISEINIRIHNSFLRNKDFSFLIS